MAPTAVGCEIVKRPQKKKKEYQKWKVVAKMKLFKADINKHQYIVILIVFFKFNNIFIHQYVVISPTEKWKKKTKIFGYSLTKQAKILFV